MNKWSRFYLPRGHPYLCPWNRTRASCHATTSSWHDLRGTGTSKTKWRLKATEKKRIIWPFLPSKWVKFSVLLIWLIYFLLIRVLFHFIFVFLIRSELVLVSPSWSDPDWRSELIPSDFCTCLLSKAKNSAWFVFLIYCDQEPLWLLNVIEDDSYFLGVRLSTRCKIKFTLSLNCLQIIFL